MGFLCDPLLPSHVDGVFFASGLVWLVVVLFPPSYYSSFVSSLSEIHCCTCAFSVKIIGSPWMLHEPFRDVKGTCSLGVS